MCVCTYIYIYINRPKTDLPSHAKPQTLNTNAGAKAKTFKLERFRNAAPVTCASDAFSS